MKKQRTNEEELELFADLIDPFAEILTDEAVRDAFSHPKKNRITEAVKVAIKKHKQAVIEIFARIDEVPVEEYRITALSIPARLVALFNKPELKDLFLVQEQTKAAESSTPATENTEDGAN